MNQWMDFRCTKEEENIVDCSRTGNESFATGASLTLVGIVGKVLSDKLYQVSGL